MAVKSKFEEGLDLLERAIPLLRQAYTEQESAIRQGIIATISIGGQARVTPLASIPAGGSGKAPRGAAEAAVREILKGWHSGVTWAEIEAGAAKLASPVSFSAIKKAVYRMKEDGVITQKWNCFTLKETG